MSTLARSILMFAAVPTLALAANWHAAPPQQTADPAPRSVAPLAPYVTWSGPDSSVQAPEIVRARTSSQWLAIWERHTGQPARRDHVQRSLIPEIDFERCMVLAIFQGKGFNSSGVILSSIEEQAGQIIVRFDERTYQVALVPGSAPRELPPVYAYGIFVLPRSDKEIVVQENVQGLKDAPDKWRERARLN